MFLCPFAFLRLNSPSHFYRAVSCLPPDSYTSLTIMHPRKSSSTPANPSSVQTKLSTVMSAEPSNPYDNRYGANDPNNVDLG